MTDRFLPPFGEPNTYAIDTDAPLAIEVMRGLNKPIVALNIGASLPQRRWPIESWRAVAEWVAGSHGTVIILGGPGDQDEARQVQDAAGAAAQVRNLAGRTNQRQTVAVMSRCDVVVSGDTGLLRLAMIIDAPTVALYGSTSPSKGAPPSDRHKVIYKGISCSPCNRAPTCEGRIECMKLITPFEVIDTVIDLLVLCGVVRV